MSIPRNEEHAEAAQADINAKKEELRSTLSPEERQRLDVIESVSRQLEMAKIPFLLFADSVLPSDDQKLSCWWQFNKMGYESDWEEMVYSAQPRMRKLLITGLNTLSAISPSLTIVVCDSDNQPCYVTKGGQGFVPESK